MEWTPMTKDILNSLVVGCSYTIKTRNVIHHPTLYIDEYGRKTLKFGNVPVYSDCAIKTSEIINLKNENTFIWWLRHSRQRVDENQS